MISVKGHYTTMTISFSCFQNALYPGAPKHHHHTHPRHYHHTQARQPVQQHMPALPKYTQHYRTGAG